MRHFFIIIAAGFFLGACGPVPQPSRDALSASDAQRAAEKIAAERQQREAVESRLRDQEASTSRWQFATALAAGLAGVALIFGITIGSRARHDASQ